MFFFSPILCRTLLADDHQSIYSVENFSRTSVYQIDHILNLINYKAVGEINSANIQDLINSYGNCYSNGMYYLTEDNTIAYETLNHILVVYFNYILTGTFTDMPFVHLNNKQLRFLLEQLTTKTIFSEHFAAFCRLYQYYVIFNRTSRVSLFETMSNFDKTTLVRQLDLILASCKIAEPIPIDLEELTERQTFIAFSLPDVFATPIVFWMDPPVGESKDPRPPAFSGTSAFNVIMSGGTPSAGSGSEGGGGAEGGGGSEGGGGAGAGVMNPQLASSFSSRSTAKSYPRSNSKKLKKTNNSKKQKYDEYIRRTLALYDPDANSADVKKIFAN